MRQPASHPSQENFRCLPRRSLLRSGATKAPSEVPQMAFCKACGQEVGTAAFCPKCGASQGAEVAPAGAGAPVAAVAASPTEGIQENVAGLLCYLFGWIS